MQYIFTEHELRTLAQEIAGRASVPFMRRNRNLGMPTAELTEGCDEILKEKFGIHPLEEPKAGMVMEKSDERDERRPEGRRIA